MHALACSCPQLLKITTCISHFQSNGAEQLVPDTRLLNGKLKEQHNTITGCPENIVNSQCFSASTNFYDSLIHYDLHIVAIV